MQNKYVADVGDFGKFQLFRYLFNDTQSPFYGKSLAQIWFMHQGENERNNDGRHIDYFKRMAGTDEYLESSLLSLLMRDRREVEELERLKLLENGRFFYDEVPRAYEDRQQWLQRAIWFAHANPIVAVAPDNGMALRCVRSERTMMLLSLKEHYRSKVNPQKYIFEEEIGHFFGLPTTEILIIYQHLGRCMSHDAQTESLMRTLRKTYRFVVAVKHKPYSPRLFFFLCKSEVISEQLRYRLNHFVQVYAAFWELIR